LRNFVSAWFDQFRSADPRSAFEPIDGFPVLDTGGQATQIVVIGGTGLLGSKTVAILRQGGHEVDAAVPQNGRSRRQSASPLTHDLIRFQGRL
jgi:hypothetical protein